MSKKALAFIVTAGQKKAISKQRALLARTVKRSEPQVSEVSEHIAEAESLCLELGSSAITQFFETVLASQSQLVAIESPCRLASDAMTVAVVVAQLEHVGLRVVFADSSASGATDVELRRVLAMALKTEKLYRQARIAIGRQANASAGGKHGGNPRYGTLPGEAETLRRIEELARKDRLGHTAIASRLNSEGIKPRNAERWQPAVIANILGVRRDAQIRAASRKTIRHDHRP